MLQQLQKNSHSTSMKYMNDLCRMSSIYKIFKESIMMPIKNLFLKPSIQLHIRRSRQWAPGTVRESYYSSTLLPHISSLVTLSPPGAPHLTSLTLILFNSRTLPFRDRDHHTNTDTGCLYTKERLHFSAGDLWAIYT